MCETFKAIYEFEELLSIPIDNCRCSIKGLRSGRDSGQYVCGISRGYYFAQHQIVFPTLTAKEAGYIFVYLSYEDQSNNYVYFDDLNVTITPTNVIQSNEYYPFGLQTANSWTRDNTTNNFLYDAGNELNSTSGFYDLPFRNYDAALGRFFQVDQLAYRDHSFTPYHYAGNDPIGWNDPSGLVKQYYATPQDDPRYRGPRDPNAARNMADPEYDPDWADAGGRGGYNPYGDAELVRSGTMSTEEYGKKYGQADYYAVYNENENENGSVTTNLSIYSDQSYWNDAGATFASDGTPLGFAVYKNGQGEEYQSSGGESSGESESSPFYTAFFGTTAATGLAVDITKGN